MARFVLDASAALHIVSARLQVPAVHKLLAPTLLRSQTLSALHEAVQRGELTADVARDHLARIATSIRLRSPKLMETSKDVKGWDWSARHVRRRGGAECAVLRRRLRATPRKPALQLLRNDSHGPAATRVGRSD